MKGWLQRWRERRRQQAVEDLQQEVGLQIDRVIESYRTVAELGPLPPGGLPVQPKRKPEVPYRPLPGLENHETLEDETMKWSQVAAMAVGMAVTQAGCAPALQEKPDGPEYRENPNPTRAFRITLRIEGAPGPFASVKGFAQYDISDPSCLPPAEKFSGVQTTPSTAAPSIAFTKVSDDTYTSTIYADRMLDADYFGKGICRWQFTQVQAELKATGAKVETAFLPELTAESVLAQKSETKYFWFGYYPRAKNSENYSDFGESSLEHVTAEQHDEFFTITLSAKEVMP